MKFKATHISYIPSAIKLIELKFLRDDFLVTMYGGP